VLKALKTRVSKKRLEEWANSGKYAKGGGVRVLKSEGRYRIYGEMNGQKPIFVEATDDREDLKKLTDKAKKWMGYFTDSPIKVFVVDTKEDREIFENQYAKGGRLQEEKDMKMIGKFAFGMLIGGLFGFIKK
jgi:hypothetical protein